MNTRQRTILDTLRFSRATAYHLAVILGDVPAASVRRDIGSLRKAGWRIDHDGNFYRMADTQDGGTVPQS